MTHHPGPIALLLVDEVLADIAVKIQLSPTLHEKAVDHYEAVRKHIERDGSPLAGHVAAFYPQGSMAVGTTIRSKDQDDLFDIDLVVELEGFAASTAPMDILNLLHEAIKGDPGSRYDGKVEKQTRCVTIYYEDMHLDITPLLRDENLNARAGVICHAKDGATAAEHKFVWANPWGFAEWFKERTPPEQWFSQVIMEKALASDGRAKADVTPVPVHQSPFRKSLTVVALQLFKRWSERNHAGKAEGTRRPPSVFLSKIVGDVAGQQRSLIDELIHQIQAVRVALAEATASGQLVDVRNPRLDRDILTDRWPGVIGTQVEFERDLARFSARLVEAKATTDIRQVRAIFADLFGEGATAAAFEEYFKRAGEQVSAGESRVAAKTGAALAGASFAPEVKSIASPQHRFFGD